MNNADLSGIPIQRVIQFREQYRATLFDDVVPWWEKHSLDRECGGYYSCLECDGRPWSTDKYMWMTGREIWMFSHLYNHHQQNPAWLDAAQWGADFMLKHAFLPDGKMNFRLARDGRPISKVLSVYTEVFASIALAEMSRAAGNEQLWAKAMQCTTSLFRDSVGRRILPCSDTLSTPSSICTRTICAESRWHGCSTRFSPAGDSRTT